MYFRFFDALILDSNLPQAFAVGFATVEKVMRALFVRKLYLRPRFHAAVSAALNAQPIDVVEIAQPLTPGMRAVQELVLDVMRACVDELRASRRGELEHVTLEAALFHSFGANIRRDLGPMWHKLRCGHWIRCSPSWPQSWSPITTSSSVRDIFTAPSRKYGKYFSQNLVTNALLYHLPSAHPQRRHQAAH
jgi:hypothetical protein